MRTLARWSESSLSMTTPRPEKAEPSRCMASPFLRALLRVRFEIARVDGLEARLLNAEIFQASLHGDNLGGRFRSHIPIGVQGDLAGPCFFDAADPGDKRETLRQAQAVSFDIDSITTTEHLPPKLRHSTHQCNAAGVKQRDSITDTLHSLQQMRRQQNRDAFVFE